MNIEMQVLVVVGLVLLITCLGFWCAELSKHVAAIKADIKSLDVEYAEFRQRAKEREAKPSKHRTFWDEPLAK